MTEQRRQSQRLENYKLERLERRVSGASGSAAAVAADLAAHIADPDAHPDYLTEAEADLLYDPLNAASDSMAAHLLAADPHPQYLTLAEGNAAYAPVSHVGAGGAAHANAVAAGAAGFMTGADKSKLDGVAVGATANSTDAFLRARANHTGTQDLDTTTDSATRLAMTTTERTKLAGDVAGTYTPTLVNVANAASSTAFVCQYMAVLDASGVRVCTVSGALTIDPTAATTSTTVRMSLPIASEIANAQEIAGTGISITGTTVTPVMIFGSAPNNDAAFVCVAPTTAAFTLYFHFTYRIL